MSDPGADTVPIFLLAPAQLFHERYRIVRTIRTGGMGAVYEATDERTAGRRALKIIHPNLLAEHADFKARFEREARILGELESDHIVRVIDAGVDVPSGLPFLAMELLRGRDLGMVVTERGALPPGEVRTYLAQAAFALDKTHAAGVVHRDIKPDNLFLTYRDDGSPCLKLLDFGIAKADGHLGIGMQTKTILGSPYFMAPEQIFMDQPIGPAVDVYALGHTAFMLLVGAPYWAEEFEKAPSIITLARCLDNPLPEPPATRARRRHAVELPAAVDAWFSRCVARNPGDRFPSASAALVALSEALFPADHVDPSHSTPPPPREPYISVTYESTPPPPARGSRPSIPPPSEETKHPTPSRTSRHSTPPSSLERVKSSVSRARSGYTIRVERERRLVRLSVWGFWTVDQARAYYEEFARVTQPLWGKRWRVLADTADFAAQKPDVSAFVERTMEVAQKNGCVRAANIVSSTLTKMQLARMSIEQGLPSFAFFQDEAEAMIWLLDGT
ncbi:protein kinase domain-containing protein [Polyangium jinanense]|uniref:Protein kinase n=1 Tax=Polyangium jinanense TaxID=2829994 RepID=A0A9X3X3Z5_9BACT|nr:protein kinase [Polyangium jinanense]MDC3955920.1 protein kinase [Polyangium jinanense]MDC3983279.1 protein kinase [Polyangium jinanense]MDC3985141.1 protein kinase [Polyangium jinanense]